MTGGLGAVLCIVLGSSYSIKCIMEVVNMIEPRDIQNFADMGISLSISVKGLSLERIKPIVHSILTMGSFITLKDLDSLQSSDLYELARYINELMMGQDLPGQVIFDLS
jgi:hypothetical protein